MCLPLLLVLRRWRRLLLLRLLVTAFLLTGSPAPALACNICRCRCPAACSM